MHAAGPIWMTDRCWTRQNSNTMRSCTMDQSLRFQQNLRGRRLRIVVVRAHSNTLPTLAPVAPLVLSALREMGEGELRVVGG